MALTEDQLRALTARATFSRPPFADREAKGVRDAQESLEAILRLHSDNPAALDRNLGSYLGEGPAWDSESYHNGGLSVHYDVSAILTGDRTVITEMLAAAAETPSRTITKETP